MAGWWTNSGSYWEFTWEGKTRSSSCWRHDTQFNFHLINSPYINTIQWHGVWLILYNYCFILCFVNPVEHCCDFVDHLSFSLSIYDSLNSPTVCCGWQWWHNFSTARQHLEAGEYFIQFQNKPLTRSPTTHLFVMKIHRPRWLVAGGGSDQSEEYQNVLTTSLSLGSPKRVAATRRQPPPPIKIISFSLRPSWISFHSNRRIFLIFGHVVAAEACARWLSAKAGSSVTHSTGTTKWPFTTWPFSDVAIHVFIVAITCIPTSDRCTSPLMQFSRMQ